MFQFPNLDFKHAQMTISYNIYISFFNQFLSLKNISTTTCHFFLQAQDNLMHELRSHRFFDVFEYNGPRKIWGCFLCNHPDRAVDFVQV